MFLLLNPFIDHSRKDLPVDVYETGRAAMPPFHGCRCASSCAVTQWHRPQCFLVFLVWCVPIRHSRVAVRMMISIELHTAVQAVLTQQGSFV